MELTNYTPNTLPMSIQALPFRQRGSCTPPSDVQGAGESQPASGRSRAILADEVGFGKTIETGLLLAQRWSERERRRQ